jgi:hypothetical protein
MPSSPKRRSQSPSKNFADVRRRLQAYKIQQPDDDLSDCPPDIAALVGRITQPRDGGAPVSTRAQRVKQVYKAVAAKGEDDGIDSVARQLFLHPLMWDGDDEYVDVTRNRDLVKGFLPTAPDATARQLGRLENPRPGM